MESRHFFPKHSQLRFQTDNNNEVRMEALKASYESEIDLSQHCLNKCEVDFNVSSEADKKWMVKCFQKFFNSTLLIEKELTMYTRSVQF